MQHLKSFQDLCYDEQLAQLGDIVDALLPHYRLSRVQRRLLQYENNAVYSVVATSGEQFVVRVGTPCGRTAEQQRSELLWLEGFRRNTSLVVPRPVRNVDGALVTIIVTEGSVEPHACVVLRWVPGEPPEPGLSPILTERLGEFTAEMHRYSERFAPEVDFVRPRWDCERLFGVDSILHDESAMTTLNSQQLVILKAAAEQIQGAVSCREKKELQQGLIHGDLHLDNILIHNSEVGVIDFDDCGFGYYLYDVACILESFSRRIFVDAAEYQEGRAALLKGYSRIRPLGADFDRYLEIFIAFRKIVTLDFILRSKNQNVQDWGRELVGSLIDQLRNHLEGGPIRS